MLWCVVFAVHALSVIAYCPTPQPVVHYDLPNPPTDNVTFAVGSWVIPLDEKQESGGLFHISAYGLLVRLLWAEVFCYWAIRGCKPIGGIDFSARARQVLPKTILPTGPFPPVQNFSLGAFLIPADLSPNALRIYTDFVRNKTAGPALTPPFTPPVVFMLEEEVTVEVRHSWDFKPKLGIVGIQNTDIHENIAIGAGLDKGVHYDTLDNNAESLLNAGSCFTVITNPHDDFKTAQNRTISVAQFVRGGGNCLLQCHGVRTYSMWAPVFGEQMIMTTPDAGMTAAADNLCSTGVRDTSRCTAVGDGPDMTSGFFRYPDLAFSQMDFTAGWDWPNGGSWSQGNVSSDRPNIRPNYGYIDLDNGVSYKALAGVIQGYGTAKRGGMIYHLASHQYKTTSNTQLNGWRAYLNAIVIPSSGRTGGCGLSTSKCCNNPRGCEGIRNPVKCAQGCLGSDYRECDWRAACAVWPSCISRSADVACFPDYCADSCTPVWANIITGIPQTCGPTPVGTTLQPTPASGACPANFKPYANFPTMYCCSGVCPPGAEWTKNCPFAECDDLCALPAANNPTFRQCNNLTPRPSSPAPTNIGDTPMPTEAPVTGGATSLAAIPFGSLLVFQLI